MIFRGYMTPIQIWNHFVALPGAQEIASPYALHAIWHLYQDRDPKSVCEVGYGIGTISFMLAMWRMSDTQIIAVEDDPWCIEQAHCNLGPMAGAVLWYDKIPHYETFDMVIVDGPQISDADWYYTLGGRAVVIFEGNRRGQRAVLEKTLRVKRRRYCRVNLKPEDRTKGIWVYWIDPTRGERLTALRLTIFEAWRDFRARLCGQPIGKRRPT